MAGALLLSTSPAVEPARPVVLLVEDEPSLILVLRVTLAAQGYRLVEATRGDQALREAALHAPDIVLLDLGLPDMDGLEVTRRLREWSAAPILVISAREREPSKVALLDAGADDYLTKPFGIPELLARIRVALRRSARWAAGREPVLGGGDLRIDLEARRVTRAGGEVHLTRTEYQLLAVLARHVGKVLTQRQLLQEMRGPDEIASAHYLRVYMGQLRRKLEPDPARPRHLLTEAGVGYRLCLD